MTINVKICGLTDKDAVASACQNGVDLLGFVFYPRSPRAVTPSQAASLLSTMTGKAQSVGLFVDPDDELLETVLKTVPLDMIQLHGRETPIRVAEIKDRFKKPIIKALPIAVESDFDAVSAYSALVDFILFDAKPPKDADRPGGNAISFDWRLLQKQAISVPWILAGGLTAETLSQAVMMSGATWVDVSSGVESAPGKKAPALIETFMKTAQAL